MKDYKVVSQFYNNGKVHAYILHSSNKYFNHVEDCETEDYDQYVDECDTKEEAEKLVEEAKNA